MKWLKKILGIKDKKEEKTLEPLLPIKDEEQPISVPIEKNIDDGVRYDEDEKETIAPTLERQEMLVEDMIQMMNDEIEKHEPLKKKSIKPKRQAKKKDNRNPDDDKKNWPGFNHFNL